MIQILSQVNHYQSQKGLGQRFKSLEQNFLRTSRSPRKVLNKRRYDRFLRSILTL